MILTPGNVFYYSGMLLLVLGNTLGVILGLLMMLSGVWLWQREDVGDLDYDDPEDSCPICGAAPGEPCLPEQKTVNFEK